MIDYRGGMRLVLLMLLVMGCTGTQKAPVKRWPYHREQSEATIAEMQRKIESLEKRLLAVEAAARVKPVPPPAPPPPPIE